jgi:sister-chromatid-cohesion protein PDS5
MIDECHHVPNQVTELILSQFNISNQKNKPTAFRLAVFLCENTAEKLHRYVGQYFADIVVKSGTEMSDDDFSEFKDAHKLILEINKSSPGVLLSVIPQIEEELKFDVQSLRLFATATLGEMFSESGTKLSNAYPSSYQAWLERYLVV